MKFYGFKFIILFFVHAIFVPSCHSVKVCDAVRCRREGSGGKIRPGHRPLKYEEMPYLAVLLKDGKPFCFGVLVKGVFNSSYEIHNYAVITTCSCGSSHGSYHIGLGKVIHMYFKVEHLVQIEKGVFGFQNCDFNVQGTFESASVDFGFALPLNKSHLSQLMRLETAYLISKNVYMINDHLDSLLKKHENNCFGVGFGGYEFITTPTKHEGKKGTDIHVYDYRLITDDECDKYVPKCCGNWKSLGVTQGSIKSTGLHCAIRNRANSSCFGNIGSPIVCDGYVIGFLKGHLKCSPDDKRYAGPDLFVPLSDNSNWLVKDLVLPSSNLRTLPERLADSLENLELEEIFPKLGEENDEKNMKYNKTKPVSDYYYYNSCTKTFKKSLVKRHFDHINIFLEL